MPAKDLPPVTLLDAAEERFQKARKELQAEWDRRLECLKRPDFAERVDAIMNARGCSKVRPKAGSSY